MFRLYSDKRSVTIAKKRYQTKIKSTNLESLFRYLPSGIASHMITKNPSTLVDCTGNRINNADTLLHDTIDWMEKSKGGQNLMLTRC